MKDINLEELGKYGIITLIISKEWIETKYLEEIDRTFKILLSDPIKFEDKIIILIEGYNNDTRPIWEINEIREYFKTLDLLFPYWFYFLKKEKEANYFGLKMIMLLLVPTKTLNNNGEIATTEFDIPEYGKFMMSHFHYLNELTDKLELPIEENKRISEEVIKCFL